MRWNLIDFSYKIARCGPGKEAWEMGMELEAQELPLHGPNRWPQHSDAAAFQQHLSVYYAQLLDFARTLLRAFCCALGLPAEFMDTDTWSPLRVSPITCEGRWGRRWRER